MVKISDYLRITQDCKNIKMLYITPELFKEYYQKLEKNERNSLLSHIVIKNIPFVFKDVPLLFEQIVQYLSTLLNLEHDDIKLIGSAKTGFSVSPKPDYGKTFSSESDLDFTIINEKLFCTLENEYNSWKDAYRNQLIIPKDSEKYYWDINIPHLQKTIARGFIDTNKIPTRNICPYIQIINNAMYLINVKLKEYHNIVTSKASTRVYKDYNSFYKQLVLNTDKVLYI